MKCKICGKNSFSDYCFKHKRGKDFRAYNITSDELNDSKEMKDFFRIIWNKRPHYSEVSHTYLGVEPFTLFFHHILPKNDNKYPEAKLDEENIILLTANEHGNVEIDMYRYPEINKRRDYLKTKYNIE